MRPIDLPPALWPFPDTCVLTRPWWRIAGQRDGGVRYVRSDGMHVDLPMSATLTDTLAALARRDVRSPLPAPPPVEGQVWSWFDGRRLVKRIVVATQADVDTETGACSFSGIVWSETSIDPSVWPPVGAQLVGGAFSPWSPVEGVSLGELLGSTEPDVAPDA